jgi:hypothetical protein
MQCCCSRWDYVAWRTKVAILGELYRGIDSENCAWMLVDSPGFPYILKMLGSPDPVAQQYSCRLLECLAQYKFAIPPILEIRICERLVSLLE